MIKLKRQVDIEIPLTATELAKLFWEMNNEEQAEFFNYLGNLPSPKLPMQLQWVTDSPNLKSEGRHAMAMIGEYS